MNLRPNYIDYSKTIGLFLVIIGHFVYHLQLPFEPSPIWKLCHFITLFHMPLFFIMSGMLMKESHIDLIFKKVVHRLLMPYIYLCSICFVLGVTILVYRGNSISTLFLKTQFLGYVSASDIFGLGYDQFSAAMWFCIALAWIQLFYAISNIPVRICAVLGGGILMYKGNVLPFRFDSALVGLIFFSIGHYGKYWFLRIASLNRIRRIIIFIIAIVVLFFSAKMNLDYYNRQCLSINAMYFGKYPPLFLISGIAGTLVVMLLAIQLSRIGKGKQFVLSISKGAIVVLGFHKMITILLKDIITIYSIPVALCYSAVNLFICYMLVIFFMKYCPIVLGNR